MLLKTSIAANSGDSLRSFALSVLRMKARVGLVRAKKR